MRVYKLKWGKRGGDQCLGEGQFQLDKGIVDDAVEWANKEYPNLIHWVVGYDILDALYDLVCVEGERGLTEIETRTYLRLVEHCRKESIDIPFGIEI